jgi:hypothetical protein
VGIPQPAPVKLEPHSSAQSTMKPLPPGADPPARLR